MKNWFIKHFSFSRKEIQGIAFLTFTLLAIWLFPMVYQLLSAHEPDAEFVSRKAEVLRFVEQNGSHVDSETASKPVDPAVQNIDYFPFDPNTLSAEEGEQLGLSKAQVRMIHNYREKGGRFYDRSDFAKIYAISEEDYKRLAPYIQIQDARIQKNKPKRDTNATIRRSSAAKKPEKELMIDLNKTDSIELIDLYGIGPSFAARIIKYRDLLGGYHSKEQLLEVYGMDTARYAGFHKNVVAYPQEVQKIPINQISYRELLRHPYVTPRQANTIVQYREQHGHYQEAADLLKIEILNEDFLRKIVPYLSFEEDESYQAVN